MYLYMSLKEEQRKDSKIIGLIQYLEDGTLPSDERETRRILVQSVLLVLVNGVLFYVNSKKNVQRMQWFLSTSDRRLRGVSMKVDTQYTFQVTNRLFKVVVGKRWWWWWEGMLTDTLKHWKGCPQWCIAALPPVVRGQENHHFNPYPSYAVNHSKSLILTWWICLKEKELTILVI